MDCRARRGRETAWRDQEINSSLAISFLASEVSSQATTPVASPPLSSRCEGNIKGSDPFVSSDLPWSMHPQVLGIGLFLTMLLTLIVGFASTYRILGQRPLAVLRHE